MTILLGAIALQQKVAQLDEQIKWFIQNNKIWVSFWQSVYLSDSREIMVNDSLFIFLFEVYGGVPEWPKGADCKSVVDDFEGSNPSPSTNQ